MIMVECSRPCLQMQFGSKLVAFWQIGVSVMLLLCSFAPSVLTYNNGASIPGTSVFGAESAR